MERAASASREFVFFVHDSAVQAYSIHTLCYQTNTFDRIRINISPAHIQAIIGVSATSPEQTHLRSSDTV